MSTIQLEVDDALLSRSAAALVRTFIERQLSLLQLQHLGKQILSEIQQAGVDSEKGIAEAREDAWQEYKMNFLQKAL